MNLYRLFVVNFAIHIRCCKLYIAHIVSCILYMVHVYDKVTCSSIYKYIYIYRYIHTLCMLHFSQSAFVKYHLQGVYKTLIRGKRCYCWEGLNDSQGTLADVGLSSIYLEPVQKKLAGGVQVLKMGVLGSCMVVVCKPGTDLIHKFGILGPLDSGRVVRAHGRWADCLDLQVGVWLVAARRYREPMLLTRPAPLKRT